MTEVHFSHENVFVTSITNQRRHFEYHKFSYCLYDLPRTFLYRHQLSVESDCMFSPMRLSYFIGKNTENYYLTLKQPYDFFKQRNMNHRFSTKKPFQNIGQ